MTIRVLIADDQELVRTGFRVIVDAEPDMEVLAEAGDGRQTIEAVTKHRPDVVLWAFGCPTSTGSKRPG